MHSAQQNGTIEKVYTIEFLEELLYEWLKRSAYFALNRLTNNVIQSNALKFKVILNLKNFRASAAWIKKFRRKYNLQGASPRQLKEVGYIDKKSLCHISIFNELTNVDHTTNLEETTNVDATTNNVNNIESIDIEGELPVCTIFGKKTVRIVCTDPKNTSTNALNQAQEQKKISEVEKTKELLNQNLIGTDSSTSNKHEYLDQYLKKISQENNNNFIKSPQTNDGEKPKIRPVALSKLQYEQPVTKQQGKEVTHENKRPYQKQNKDDLNMSTEVDSENDNSTTNIPDSTQHPVVSEANLETDMINQVPVPLQCNLNSEQQQSFVCQDNFNSASQMPLPNQIFLPFITPMETNGQTPVIVQFYTTQPESEVLNFMQSPPLMAHQTLIAQQSSPLIAHQPPLMPSIDLAQQQTMPSNVTNLHQNQFNQQLITQFPQPVLTETCLSQTSCISSIDLTEETTSPNITNFTHNQPIQPTYNITNIIQNQCSQPTITQIPKSTNITRVSKLKRASTKQIIKQNEASAAKNTPPAVLNSNTLLTQPTLNLPLSTAETSYQQLSAAQHPTSTSSTSISTLSKNFTLSSVDLTEETTSSTITNLMHNQPTQPTYKITNEMQNQRSPPIITQIPKSTNIITVSKLPSEAVSLRRASIKQIRKHNEASAPKNTPSAVLNSNSLLTQPTLNLPHSIAETSYQQLPPAQHPTSASSTSISTLSTNLTLPTVDLTEQTSPSNNTSLQNQLIQPTMTHIPSSIKIKEVAIHSASPSKAAPTITVTPKTSKLPSTTSTTELRNCRPIGAKSKFNTRTVSNVAPSIVSTSTPTLTSPSLSKQSTLETSTTTAEQQQAGKLPKNTLPVGVLKKVTLRKTSTQKTPTSKSKTATPNIVHLTKKYKLRSSNDGNKTRTKYAQRKPLKTDGEVLKCIKLMDEFAKKTSSIRLRYLLQVLEHKINEKDVK